MAVNDVTLLFKELIKALDNEKIAIETNDMELLEKTGSEIVKILTDIEEISPAAGTDQVAVLVEEASQKRKENRKLLEALLEQTGRELSELRQGKKVHQAYSSEHSQSEMFVRKNC